MLPFLQIMRCRLRVFTGKGNTVLLVYAGIDGTDISTGTVPGLYVCLCQKALFAVTSAT